MSFWDKVNSELKKAVEEGWSVVRDSAKKASEKTEEVAKTGKLRYRSHLLHKDAEKVFADLGGMVYEMAKPPYDNPFSNAGVMRLVEEIRRVEDEAAVIEEEVVGIIKEVTTKNTKEKRSGEEAKVKSKKSAAKKAAPKKKPSPKKSAAKKPANKSKQKETGQKETCGQEKTNNQKNRGKEGRHKKTFK